MATGIDSIQDRNISAVFNVLDANGNGTITASDLEAIGRQVCARFGIDVAGAHGRKVLAAYDSWWQQLRPMDADDDGRITPAEFAAAYRSGDSRAFFDEPLGRITSVVAEMIDTDHDGFITEREYRTLLGLAVSDQEVVLAGFRQLDTDRDGRISLGEFRNGVAAVMLSNDPATPGTAMLGQTR